MKYPILLILICIVHIAYCQEDKRLQQYLDDGNVFKLRDALPNAILPTEKRLYYEAFVDNAFNQNELSIIKADSLLNSSTYNTDKKTTAGLLELQIDNYSKLFQYKKAADYGDLILKNYANDVSDADAVANITRSWRALADMPVQKIERTGDVIIRTSRDKSHLLNVPVHGADTTIDFIFDTGANISTITESTAKKLNVKKLNISFDVESLLGNKVKSDLGIADSIEIGNMKIRNVVFIIMPDASLSFPQANFYIRGIIGYPVIRALKEIHILKTAALEIPLVPTDSKLKNLATDGFTPLVQAVADNDTLLFTFDTGAMETVLYDNYYTDYVKGQHRHGRNAKVKMGGAGKIEKIKSYKLKQFHLRIGKSEATMKTVNVFKNNVKIYKNAICGNIGQNLIEQFDEMVINFESMYIEFK